MKCPKCHYLSFEPEPQCRNCGYNLELAEADLQLRHDTPADDDDRPSPFADLELHDRARREAAAGADYIHPYGEVDDADEDAAAAVDEPPVWAPFEAPVRSTVAAGIGSEPEVDETGLPPARRPAVAVKAAPAPVADGGLPPPRRPAAPPPTGELPLFVKKAAPDSADPEAPIIRVPDKPRPPVAVQRRAPDMGRTRTSAPTPAVPPRQPRPQPPAPSPAVVQAGAPPAPPQAARAARAGSFERDLLEDLQRLDRIGKEKAAADDVHDDRAQPAARLTAAAIDLAFLGSVSLAIVLLTLRWCGLGMAEFSQMPIVPVAAFVCLIALGYQLLFTAAGGQTIGKIACGLRVTDALEDGRSAGPVTPRQACLRAVASLPSVLALGAGFLPALIGEGRAFHDRLAQTRVVRL